MTVEQAAEKWGFSKKSVTKWCREGIISGWEMVSRPGGGRKLVLPDDTPRPDRRRGYSPIANGVTRKYTRVMHVIARPEGPPLTRSEIEGHLLRFAGTHTYRQLQQETGLPTDEIRAIYDRLHAQYGI